MNSVVNDKQAENKAKADAIAAKEQAKIETEKAKVAANQAKIKQKQEDIKKAAQKKIDTKYNPDAKGGCGCGGGDKKEDDKDKPAVEDGKLPKVYGPVGCGCKKCQKDAINKIVKTKKEKKVEKKQIQQAKIKAKKIKAHNHEKKMIDKKVNEQRDLLKNELDKINEKTDKAVK